MTRKLEKKLPDATFFIRDLDEATNVRDRLETLFTIREDLGESTNIEGLIEEKNCSSYTTASRTT
jgi:hypothetical protein